MNGVQTRFKCKLDVKRCKRFVFPPSSLLPRSNALKTKAIRYFQTDRTLTRIVSPPLSEKDIEHVVKELHPDIAVVWIDSLTPQFVKKCREHNLQVLALVLGLDDKTEENQKAVDLGVDIIATDHPEKFIMKYGKPSI